MFLLEPPRTQFDLNFRIGPYPVRVHPFFWLAALILFAAPGALQSPHAPMLLAIWTCVLFFSILIHELGHAVVMRYFGDRPSIVIYHFGGLAIPSGAGGGGGFYDSGWRPQTRLTPFRKIQISFAGPLAGFLLAFAAIVVARLAGVEIVIDWEGAVPLPKPAGIEERVGLNFLLRQLLWVNIFWGLINLLPIYPLDGGQIARELFTLSGDRDALRKSLYLSLFTAIGAGIVAFSLLGQHGFFTVILFGSLAFGSWQMIQQMSRF